MKKLLMILQITFFCGCSNILMPYNEDFSCTKGVGAGTCSSMTENYKAIEENRLNQSPQSNAKNVKQGQSDDSTCKKCADMEETIWVRQRALEKEAEQRRRGY